MNRVCSVGTGPSGLAVIRYAVGMGFGARRRGYSIARSGGWKIQMLRYSPLFHPDTIPLLYYYFPISKILHFINNYIIL